MAPDISCFFLVALFSASCEAIASSEQTCIEVSPNRVSTQLTLAQKFEIRHTDSCEPWF